MTARTALELATRFDRAQFAGAGWDVVAALILCQVDSVDFSFINGRKIVDRSQLVACDLPILIERTDALSGRLMRL